MVEDRCVNCDALVNIEAKFCFCCGVLLDECGKSNKALALQEDIADDIKRRLRLSKDVLVVSVDDADPGYQVSIELEKHFQNLNEFAKDKLPSFGVS